jgi:hypothetical protein
VDCVIQRHICDRRRLTVGRPVSSRRLRHPWPGSPARLGFLFMDTREGLAGPFWVISIHFAAQSSCPLYPRKRTCAVHYLMSISANSGHRASYSITSSAATRIEDGTF